MKRNKGGRGGTIPRLQSANINHGELSRAKTVQNQEEQKVTMKIRKIQFIAGKVWTDLFIF